MLLSPRREPGHKGGHKVYVSTVLARQGNGLSIQCPSLYPFSFIIAMLTINTMIIILVHVCMMIIIRSQKRTLSI